MNVRSTVADAFRKMKDSASMDNGSLVAFDKVTDRYRIVSASPAIVSGIRAKPITSQVRRQKPGESVAHSDDCRSCH